MGILGEDKMVVTSNPLEQEQDGVAFTATTELDQSNNNSLTNDGDLDTQAAENQKNNQKVMGAQATASNINNGFVLADKGKALALRTNCGYNTGHGDFCYGRYSDRIDNEYADFSLSYMPWYPKGWIEGSSVVFPANILPFERYALSLEIKVHSH
ncbi:hypothetical protein N431DRAFT_440684 [Stipitochalara longipes BDJ]|nr:hypothetical protein N431DRAFT_440684 [Stipitochalara longipes BDJ]